MRHQRRLVFAVGASFYLEAAATTLALLVILAALKPVENRLLRGHRKTVLFQLREGKRPSELLALLESEQVEVEDVTLDPRAEPPAVLVRFRGWSAKVRRLVTRAAEAGIAAGEGHDDDQPPGLLGRRGEPLG